MALPTLDELKAVCRIQSTAEDTLCTSLLAQATAVAEAIMQRPILTESRAMTDEAAKHVAYGVVTKLLIPVTPVDLTTVVITDADAVVLSVVDDYRLGDAWSGLVYARPGVAFSNPPYTITADVGLETAGEYIARIEPVVAQAILDLAADLWHRRNPAVQSESAGGGVSTTYVETGVPRRAREALAPFSRVRVA